VQSHARNCELQRIEQESVPQIALALSPSPYPSHPLCTSPPDPASVL
jgi:hypothetical protein